MNKSEHLAWFKSSYSNTEGGQCLEVAAGPEAIHVRDSKIASGPVLHISRHAWTGLLGLATAD
ncbi:DUF397 domain-containing protein [Streptomyces sp. SID9124]|uniref:DUF397 domain-containing protein n=1 Tax=Streptomyces sp. SID9124 TaxID=2706108 RepID=UPI0013E08379|nr:DUF397 domain-containing protein [Streptomyces sp. SID9124]NED11877.1 DUF397 domain-containing protein [Streptomyces sp. SID9124]